MTATELPMDLVERGIDALDEVLQGWHDRHCDTVRQGSCWCCCIDCTESDLTANLRNSHQEFMYEKARREGKKCGSDSPVPGTDAPTLNGADSSTN